MRIAASPERGRANEALLDLLARELKLPRDRVRIAGGHTSRRKLVEVDGLAADELGRRLDAAAR
jgi:uncharacterized protein